MGIVVVPKNPKKKGSHKKLKPYKPKKPEEKQPKKPKRPKKKQPKVEKLPYYGRSMSKKPSRRSI